MVEYSIVARPDLCLGCPACEIACKQEHDILVGPSLIRVIQVGPEEVEGRLRLSFQLVRCMHCDKPDCIEACPENAITKRIDGIVIINDKLCTGCGACIEACPFEAPQYNPEKNVVVMCNLCVHRVDKGLKPACVLACPTGALLFDDVNKVTEEASIL